MTEGRTDRKRDPNVVVDELVDRMANPSPRRLAKATIVAAACMATSILCLAALVGSIYLERNSRRAEVDSRICAIVNVLADPRIAPDASAQRLRTFIHCPVPTRR